MGRRGKYKYICEDCNAENWLTDRDRSSRFRPKCIECGSTWLKPSPKSKGPEKLADKKIAIKENILIQKKKMGIKD